MFNLSVFKNNEQPYTNLENFKGGDKKNKQINPDSNEINKRIDGLTSELIEIKSRPTKSRRFFHKNKSRAIKNEIKSLEKALKGIPKTNILSATFNPDISKAKTPPPEIKETDPRDMSTDTKNLLLKRAKERAPGEFKQWRGLCIFGALEFEQHVNQLKGYEAKTVRVGGGGSDHYVVVVKPPSNAEPIIIDPTWKQFSSCSAEDGVLIGTIDEVKAELINESQGDKTLRSNLALLFEIYLSAINEGVNPSYQCWPND